MTGYPIHPLIPLAIIVAMLAGLALVLVILNWREPVSYPTSSRGNSGARILGIAMLIASVLILALAKL